LQFLGRYWYERNQADLGIALLKAGLAIKEGRDFGPADLQDAYRRFRAA